MSDELQILSRLNKQSTIGNFFQSIEFYHVLEQARLNPFVITIAQNEDLAGLLAYSAPRAMRLLNHFPKISVYYGPILARGADPSVMAALLRRLESKALKRRAIRIDIRTSFQNGNLDYSFKQNGYTRFDPGGEYSVVIDLTKDENTLWKEMRKTTRYEINKAIKKNIKIKEITNDSDLRCFYQIYLDTARRRNLVPHTYSFFNGLKKLQLAGITKFFLAWYNDKPIAGILNTAYNGQSIPFIAASLEDYWRIHPNRLLFWHSICWSRTEARCHTFKLYHLPMSKDKRNSIDHYTYKTSFGGNIIRECSFYYKILSSFKFNALEAGSKIWQMAHISRRSHS